MIALTTIEQASPEWLTEVLRRQGCLPSGQVVLRYPQRTVANERTLVKRYHERLLAYGVHDYGWETCWRDYRLLAAEHVLYPLRWWMSGLPQDFWGMFVRPALTGFRDLGCADLLS